MGGVLSGVDDSVVEENLEEALNAATRDFCSKNVDVLPPPPQGLSQSVVPGCLEV